MKPLKEQISSSIDNELDSRQIEALVDKLLEQSAEGQKLRMQWQHMHMVSQLASQTVLGKPLGNSQQVFKSITVHVHQQIHTGHPQETESAPSRIEPEREEHRPLDIQQHLPRMVFVQRLIPGLAIAASLALVFVNVIHIGSEKKSSTELEQTANNDKTTLVRDQVTNISARNASSIKTQKTTNSVIQMADTQPLLTESRIAGSSQHFRLSSSKDIKPSLEASDNVVAEKAKLIRVSNNDVSRP